MSEFNLKKAILKSKETIYSFSKTPNQAIAITSAILVNVCDFVGVKESTVQIDNRIFKIKIEEVKQ